MSETTDFLLSAKQFAHSSIRPYASMWDENEDIPREFIRELGLLGYLSPNLPREYGGQGLDPVSYGLFQLAFGKADCAIRSLITVHSSLCGESLLRWGNEQQRAEWLPRIARGDVLAGFALSEEYVGSDAKSVRTQYRRVGDGFVLNGEKKWVSFGGQADLFIVIATSTDDDITSAFLVEKSRPGVQAVPIRGMMAAKATSLTRVVLNNVEIPKENLLGREGIGFSHVAATALDHGRYSIAWAGASLAEEAVDQMVTYSRTRKQFGKFLADFQTVRGLIADAITQAHAAKAFCLHVGDMRRRRAPHAMSETAMAKCFCSQVAVKCADTCVQVHGGNGLVTEFSAERLYREARLLEIIEGTTQIQHEIIAKFGLQEYFKSEPNF